MYMYMYSYDRKWQIASLLSEKNAVKSNADTGKHNSVHYSMAVNAICDVN